MNLSVEDKLGSSLETIITGESRGGRGGGGGKGYASSSFGPAKANKRSQRREKISAPYERKVSLSGFASFGGGGRYGEEDMMEGGGWNTMEKGDGKD